jgi:phosphoglucan, water dikinase
VAFQLSRLCTLLLRASSKRLGEGAFEGVVLGSSCGKLLEVESIEPGMVLAGDTPCILLVKRATGDEEVCLLSASSPYSNVKCDLRLVFL